MKITILSSSKKLSGGVERFSWYLHDGLVARGHEVSIVSREDLGRFAGSALKFFSPIGMDQPILGWLLGRKAVTDGFGVCITNGMLGWTVKNRKTINVQHGTFIRGAIRTRHDDPWIKYFIKRYVWSSFEEKAARRATVCVAVSEETRETVVDYYGVTNAVTIPNAIDTNVFVPGERIAARTRLGLPLNKHIVFFASRLGSQKAARLIHDIAKKIRDRNDGTIVVGAVFGQAFSEESGIMGLADFSNEKLVDAYNAADVFLLPSRHEGSSLALLEAMSCGIPFLASPVGLVPELRKGQLFSECVVVTQSADSYLAQLDHLLSLTQQEKNELSGKLRTYILERHSLGVFCDSYDALIRKIATL